MGKVNAISLSYLKRKAKRLIFTQLCVDQPLRKRGANNQGYLCVKV